MTLLTFACPSRFCIASCNVSGMGPAQCKLKSALDPSGSDDLNRNRRLSSEVIRINLNRTLLEFEGLLKLAGFHQVHYSAIFKFIVLVRAVLTFLIQNPGLGPGARRRVGLLAGWHGQPWQHSLRVRLTRSRSRRPGTRSGRKL